MKQFDLKTTPLHDVNLIEASAGTGKTFTLAGLYLRLILEHQLNVDQILVVTYTRAATQELRDRLRKKLSDERNLIVTEQPGRTQDLKRLELAIQSFDEAAIFTIHSFCQQVLKDFAFESGSPFEMDLMGDDCELLQAVTDDFWRRNVVPMDSEFSAYLLARKQTPETLLQSIRSLMGKPYLQIQDLPEVDAAAAKQAAIQGFQNIKQLWHQHRDDYIAMLNNKKILSGRKYRADWVSSWVQMLEDLLSETDLPSLVFEQFDRFTISRIEEALVEGQDLPHIEFWQGCEDFHQAFHEYQRQNALALQHLRLQLLRFIREQLPQQKIQQQVQSYDDLLINLSQALQGPQGAWLITRLREQFKAALIDEFQDTDPVQYDNFRRVFADSGLPVFFVGDPKQAIYSFRGADIFTYLTAKQDANETYTLGKNWRSHHSLVSAVNRLFMQTATPFVYEQIPFVEVDASRDGDPALTLDDVETSALQFFYVDSDKPDKPHTLEVMRKIAVDITADEIARLLNAAAEGKARLFNENSQQTRAINGGDIAVLVRSHRDAEITQQALRQRGINSVQQGRENVFASKQATDLACLMLALAQPDHFHRLSTVLAGPLFQYSAEQLYQIQQDEAQWNDLIEQLQRLQQRWLHSGFMAMFRALLQLDNGLQRLLQQPDGERQLTNFLHLAELVQAESACQNHHIEAVNQWFARQQQASDTEDETAQLRLESDAALVKIITIHSSKGLEYPIVFCPFNWTSRKPDNKAEIIEFHDPAQQHAASVALAEPLLSEAQTLAQQEKQAEELRLLYVALTRARERCVIVWGNVKGIDQSALYQLLHGENSAGMREDLQALSASSGGTISVTDYQPQPPMVYQASQSDVADYKARAFNGEIHKPWRIGSFSLLSRGHVSEQPDYDAEPLMVETGLSNQRNTMDRFGFERGRQAGNFLHKCLENIEFDSAVPAQISVTVSRLLPQFGLDLQWTEVVTDWLYAVINTPLNAEGLRLSDLKAGQRVNEMAFYFPVAGLNMASLKTVLQQTPTDSIWQPLARDLHFHELTGFMKGFIDLVFESQGRFYLADYKSNHLGFEPAHYQGEALHNAMLSHGYPLQYLIYSVALHRHLQQRLPNYDPELHFGGVYYLFIRGMQPDDSHTGVYFDRLDRRLLEAVDQLMAGER
ncbi:exodeoxyribonuclease V subunit beta [Methylophaga lonarensis MPL]|uniref:RecBCD enzyme subunit RecB n=1 Tax=Methylophaga lonarensis MPL TaxID=1286106 RepID=M7P314_9GAMM|nr:exodeoxyribonuclease V subunit beta [Methylophaga lonarensis]EMR13887.1 exodeoxyribonuclease V subunit beta [Methylophaga lonarensis MPL]